MVLSDSSSLETEVADFKGAACAFGVFDGVHQGHVRLLGQVREDARRHGGSSVVITFDKDPDELFSSGSLRKVMTNEERLRSLAAAGVDRVAVIPFDQDVASCEPEAFLDELFAKGAPRALFVGEDFRFGHRASGDVGMLKAWGRHHGMEVQGIPLLELEGESVTSSRIRKLVAAGDVEEAARLLGRPHSLTGTVVQGRQVGREMGIATANLSVAPELLIPQDGVYAGYGIVDGKRYRAAISVGVPVTFEGVKTHTIEAHLLDFSDEIYAKELTLQFVRHLRPMIKFDDAHQLAEQINADIVETCKLPLEQ